MSISKFDKNFAIKTDIKRQDIKFFTIEEKPFEIYGVFKEDGKYVRMPGSVAKSVSEGVYGLYDRTAGGRVKFKTDSSYVSIYAKLKPCCKLPHMSLTGSVGLDLYADGVFVKPFVPPFDINWKGDTFENIIDFQDNKMRDITINMSLYSGVEELYIGLQKDAEIKSGSPYSNAKPIVYYGSSITQGACASRPGTCYQAIISREFNYDYINLGFSGNAKGEKEMAEYIAALDMSMFVYDYDHNASSVGDLDDTHERMFKCIRNNHPDIPVIMMSRPKYSLTEVEVLRRNVVEKTYKSALASGDKNVYFLDGKALTELCGGEGTVDSTHPTDFGFASMAHALIKIMKNIKIS